MSRHLPAPLTDPWFEAHFYYQATPDGWSDRRDGAPVPFAFAQGLFLWCPCGYGLLEPDGSERFPLDLSLNRGRPHGLMVPFSNPPSGIALPDDHGPVSRASNTHPRWTVSGSGLEDLTVTPSIAVGTPECWHGFITAGVVT